MKQRAKKPTGAPKYDQFGIRMSSEEKERLSADLDTLYDKFNQERNQGAERIKAVKRGDILKEAIRIGMAELRKRKHWDWEDGSL